MADEPIVMSPEQLWAPYDEEIEKYRGEPVEITDYEHKMARDLKEFAKNFDKLEVKNETRVYTSAHEQYEDDEEFFDKVTITYPSSQ